MLGLTFYVEKLWIGCVAGTEASFVWIGGSFGEETRGQSGRKRSRHWALWTPATLQLFSDALVEVC